MSILSLANIISYQDDCLRRNWTFYCIDNNNGNTFHNIRKTLNNRWLNFLLRITTAQFVSWEEYNICQVHFPYSLLYEKWTLSWAFLKNSVHLLQVWENDFWIETLACDIHIYAAKRLSNPQGINQMQKRTQLLFKFTLSFP